MEEELNLDNILGAEEIDNLFSEGEDIKESSNEDLKEKDDINKEETTEVVVEELFTEEPESVGSGKENQEKEEDTESNKRSGTSPQNNFYSSIASALKDEGIFPELEDDVVNNIKTPEEFAEAVEKSVLAKFNERQKRIDAALQADIEPNEIRKYELTLSNLDAIKDEYVIDESDRGEKLRKNLIYLDFINRGYSDARAKREVEKSFSAGTDIEDAKEALQSNKEFFNKQYLDLIKEAQEEAEAEKLKIKEESALLKKSMLEDKEVFKGIALDNSTRQKAYDNITKPVFKTEDGEYLTAIQKYEAENPVEFRKYLSILFTMTDGFQNMDNIVKGKVKKEVNKSLRELEYKLKNTSRNHSGNPIFVGETNDEESYLGKGWNIDV